MEQPSLSPTAANAVKELRKDYDIEPTLDEVVWLHEAGKRVEDPTYERLDRLGIPVRAGNAWLWPMTIMGAIWYNEQALKWFWYSDKFLFYCLAFAMAHGRGLEIEGVGALRSLVDRSTAHLAVKRWSAGLGCTRRELEAAVDECTGPATTEKKRALAKTDMMQFSVDLAVMTGIDPVFWQQCVARDALVNAYARAVAIQAARGGQSIAPIKDASAHAIEAFRGVVVAIIRAHGKQPKGMKR
jgi:hypothetical protein